MDATCYLWIYAYSVKIEKYGGEYLIQINFRTVAVSGDEMDCDWKRIQGISPKFVIFY